MRQNRQPQSIRPITVTPGYSRHAEGSALVEWGHTKVLATVTIEAKLPPHLRNKKGQKGGWLTAEYALLPRSTQERTQRERLYAGGRTQEIQRLLGRVLRSVTDLTLFANQTLTIDVDVLEADGGTRCAAITGGYVALELALARLVEAGSLPALPLVATIAAVSCGVVDGTPVLDLDYPEDSNAEVDMNVVMTGEGGLVEVQATGERTPLSRTSLDELLVLAAAGIERLRGAQRAAVDAGRA